MSEIEDRWRATQVEAVMARRSLSRTHSEQSSLMLDDTSEVLSRLLARIHDCDLAKLNRQLGEPFDLDALRQTASNMLEAVVAEAEEELGPSSDPLTIMGLKLIKELAKMRKWTIELSAQHIELAEQRSGDNLTAGLHYHRRLSVIGGWWKHVKSAIYNRNVLFKY